MRRSSSFRAKTLVRTLKGHILTPGDSLTHWRTLVEVCKQPVRGSVQGGRWHETNPGPTRLELKQFLSYWNAGFRK